MEGKRADYTPYNCIKIITTNVGPGENHGCPFKHSDVNHLRQKLLGYGLSVNDVGDVIDLTSRGHFQLACTRYFEIIHNVRNAKGVNHPNQYFEESQNLISDPGKVGASGRKSDAQAPSSRKSIPDDWGNDSGFDLDLTAVINSAENGGKQD